MYMDSALIFVTFAAQRALDFSFFLRERARASDE